MTRRPSALDLGFYDLPEFYEQPFSRREADVAYYLEKARALGGPILEYGAGAGRVTLPLLREGFDVTALDLSRPMLALLKERLAEEPAEVRARARVVRADMRRKDLGARFPLVLATFNVVGHLPRLSDMQGWLSRVKAALAPGGALVFDVPLPFGDELEADPDELHRLPPLRDPKTKRKVEVSERYSYDHASQCLTVETHLLPEGARDALVQRLVLRQWFPQEIAALLEYEGFEVTLSADYTELPAAVAEETLIVTARLPQKKKS